MAPQGRNEPVTRHQARSLLRETERQSLRETVSLGTFDFPPSLAYNGLQEAGAHPLDAIVITSLPDTHRA